MERSKRTSKQDARVRMLNFTLVDVLTVLVVLAAVVLIKPQFENMLQRGQRDSVSQPVEANQPPAPQPPAESETLLLARPWAPGRLTIESILAFTPDCRPVESGEIRWDDQLTE
ncbi:MAG: hypothetical protein QGH60_05965 [Phycisphaerae bacterium]|jgi:hypothetical protein|nr:hypothetical protein [Phycisphaerae bacterium]